MFLRQFLEALPGVDTVSAVPVFHLACTPDERAVQILEKEGLF